MTNNSSEDCRFRKALALFNSSEWYKAHDLFEELWHETLGPERTTLQGFLQIAVAQIHLDNGNQVGATILFGEGLGRLRTTGLPDHGLDLEYLCRAVEDRLFKLQHGIDPASCTVPSLRKRSNQKVN